MKRISKLITAVLLLICVSSFSAFADEPAGQVFEINSAEDFRQFSRNCRTNTWSDGVTVELNADLDLSGTGAGNVAYFNGTFHGNSHRIENREAQSPLFQTVGPYGRISDLTFTASVASTRDKTAAFVSENNGALENITVDADVSGKATAGILAGENEESGSITACEVSGTLTADSSAGGIAGKNKGLIDSCVNRATINNSVDDSNVSAEDVKDIMENVLLTKSLNNTENLRIRIDTGGIAGYNMNSGTILNSSNEGTVGYPHNGYNTGGICGRTGGVVESCENRGRVYGRRGVGGIAGKQQPEITLDFSEDVLSSMSQEMDDINSLITETLNTSEDITNTTYDRLNGLSQSMTEVKNSTNVMYNASMQRFDEVADSVNTNTDVVLDVTDDVAAYTEGLSESFDSLNQMASNIDSSIDAMTEAFELTGDQRERILSLNNQLRSDLNTVLPFVEEVRQNALPEVPEERRARISEGLSSVNRLAGDIRAMKTLLSALRSMRDRIADGSIQVDAARRDRALSDSVSAVLDSLDDLDTATSRLAAFSSSLGGSLSDVAGGVNIDLQKNEAVRAAGNDLYAGLDSISGQIDTMNAGAREDSLEVIANLNEINAKFSHLTDLMKNERDRLNNIADNGGIFEDNSDGVNSASRIVSCRNRGDVDGDTQAGGIAGTIGVEYDLDPDEDILRSNNRSLDYSFGVSAAIFDSVNEAEVTAKENHAGGIIGKADMGYFQKNTNEGDVTSDDGYFVGGIVGYAEATLDGNIARCRVTGTKNIGGIVGHGTVLRNNLSAVTLLGTEEYAGAIAGTVKELTAESIQNNLYYSGNFGAIDNIDYAGMAEKAAEPMETVLVKFKVNGHLVGLEEVKSGTVLKDVPIPETEQREGFYLKWDTDMETVITEDTVVDSSYCLPVEALSSKEKFGDTQRPLLIADGQFREGDALTFRAEGENHYFVTIPEDGLTERRIRVLRPSARKCHVTVNGQEIETGTFGEYLTFTTGERELEILIEQETFPCRYPAIAAGVIAALIILAVCIGKAKKKKAKPEEMVEEKAEEKAEKKKK